MKTLLNIKYIILLFSLLIINLFILFAPSLFLVDKLSNSPKDLRLFVGIGQLVLMAGIIIYALLFYQFMVPVLLH
jgi:hypothetical protein